MITFLAFKNVGRIGGRKLGEDLVGNAQKMFIT